MHISSLASAWSEGVLAYFEVLPNLFRVAKKFCACQVSLLVQVIISSNDILDLDMIQREAASDAQFFFLET